MNISKKIMALVVASAILSSGALIATSAQAAPITSGTLAITPLSGNVNTDTVFLNTLDINVTAPTGFVAAGGTFVYQGGVEMGNVSAPRFPSMSASYGTTGLDGSLTHLDRFISPTNNFLSSKLLNQITKPLVTGQFELRSYYFASATAPNRATDPYVTLNMTFDAATGDWAVKKDAAPATATTTSLTAQASGLAVTLAAKVAPTAAGTVSFLEGATEVANVAVDANGSAVANLPTVAYGQHIYTAAFTPSVPADFTGSTSGTATVQVGGQQATTTVTTSIAAGAGAGVLTLTGVPSTVALGAATLNGSTLNASGTLNAVVTDSRQLDYPSWSLTGQIADFTSGSKVLSGKYLGWTPAVTGAPNSVAGAVVLPAPATVSGLKAISSLATGAPNDVEVTNVSALLQLKAPKNTPAGNYSAVLTLTLI